MKNKIDNLPEKPGSYIYRNASGTIIYVGKAKNLKNRVRSYFHSPASHTQKVNRMVGEIDSIEYFITDSETEALLLECNLIKQHRPRYNILMKDDKTYPYLKLSLKEAYPMLTLTRKRLNDKAAYYGPYINSYDARKTIDAIHLFYPMKKCQKKAVFGKKTGNVCLNYHLGLCPGVCTGKISPDAYNETVQSVKSILSGNYSVLTEKLTETMLSASEQLNFETAGEMKKLLNNVAQIFEKQKINDSSTQDRDIIGLYSDPTCECAGIVVFMVRSGKLVNTKSCFMSQKDDTNDDILSAFIGQYYISGGAHIPPEIIVEKVPAESCDIEGLLSELKGSKVKILTAQRGDKKRLLALAEKNARMATETRKTQQQRKQDADELALEEIRKILGMAERPKRIECFDISNISGSETVGAMVVYEDGKRLAKAMRKFRIKYTEGQDDYASTAEIVFRRLSRAKEELEGGADEDEAKFLPLPYLIFADGGQAHMKVIKAVVENFGYAITVAGLVKDSRHKLAGVVTPFGETIPIGNMKYSALLLNEISEQVHKQAIGYHRISRSRSMLSSELCKIPGIGESRALSLLKAFDSMEQMKKASVDELAQVPGMNHRAAQSVAEYFTLNDSASTGEPEGNGC